MFTYLIPFMLVLSTNVERDQVKPLKEYVFNFDYLLRMRELYSTIQMTGKLICLSPLDYPLLRCFLQNVRSKRPIIIKNENLYSKNYGIQYVEKDIEFNHACWFEIEFNHHGAQIINVRHEYENCVKADNAGIKKALLETEQIIDPIISIAYLFKIDSDKIRKNLIIQSTSGSSVFTSTETLAVGTCDTMYNMTVTFKETDDILSSDFQIIPRVLLKYSEKKDVHVQIEKYVKTVDAEDGWKCDKRSVIGNFRGSYVTDDYLHDIDMVSNLYSMEMTNGKLNIFNSIIVRRSPNRWGPNDTFLMYQKTLLNLSHVRNAQSKQPDWEDYDWIRITI